MNKSNFAKVGSFFEAEVDGIKISISDTAMSDETLQLAEKVLLAYPKRIAAIAEYISQDEWIASTYNLSKEEITEKLNKPNILMFERGGQLSYCENEIDFDHILDVEFGGALEEFYEVGMDG
jgi:hypothetical protein